MNTAAIYAQHGELIRSAAFTIGFWALLFASYWFFGRKATPPKPCKMCGKDKASEDGLCSTCWWDTWVDEWQT